MDAPALRACVAVARAHAALARRFDARLGAWHGLSFAELALLVELVRAPDGRLRRVDLANALRVTQSAVTRALSPLEKIGLIRRQADPRDARVSYAVLSAAGRRRVEEALETAASIADETFEGTGADTDALVAALELIARP